MKTKSVLSKLKLCSLTVALLFSVSMQGEKNKMNEAIFSFVVMDVETLSSDVNGLRYYREVSLHAKITEILQGKIKEKIGDIVTFRPYIYSGPILSRPIGLWVGITFDEAVPKRGQVWTAYCSEAAVENHFISNFLGGLGESCRVVLANQSESKTDGVLLKLKTTFLIDGKEVSSKEFKTFENTLSGKENWYCKDKQGGGVTGWMARDKYGKRYEVKLDSSETQHRSSIKLVKDH